MESLADWFVEAEKAIRRAAFSSQDYPRVTHAVETELRIASPAKPKTLLARTHGALIGGRDIEQVAFLSAILVAIVLAVYRLWTLARWFSGRHKRSRILDDPNSTSR